MIALLLACNGSPDETGVEEEVHLCGDGVVDEGETCDDGNLAYDDGCTPECQSTEGFEGFDEELSTLFEEHGIPGASVAVVYEGRLVLVRAYGEADEGRLANASDTGRIASLSKAVTSAAVLRLVEEGLLDLDAPAFALLPDLEPDGGDADSRLADITVRHLLLHTGGWDRNLSGDPMFDVVDIAAEMGLSGPASVDTVVEWARTQPLDHDPGTTYAYSNLGYAVLGRIIERLSGQTYQAYVQEQILGPAGITRMTLGRSLPQDRGPEEWAYFPYPGQSSAASVFDGSSVPWPDGGFYLEAMDSHGAWVASATDLLRFVTAVDGRDDRPDVLSSSSVATMTEKPALWAGSSYWYGFGWLVRDSANDQNWWHSGSLPGSMSLFVRAYNGFSWAVIVNTRPSDSGAFSSALDAGMWQAIDRVEDWPQDLDLFDTMP